MKPLMTTTAIATGGRAGRSRLVEGGMALAMSLPKELDGKADGMNPEQLFALGYASCYGQAMIALAPKHGLDGSKAEVSCAVTLNKDDTSFMLSVELTGTLPGADKDKLRALMEAAHQICPYSRATRDNIDVSLNVA
jgi:lipoyl-dependent peroxiredoxin